MDDNVFSLTRLIARIPRGMVKLCRYMRGVYVTAFDTAKVSRSPLSRF